MSQIKRVSESERSNLLDHGLTIGRRYLADGVFHYLVLVAQSHHPVKTNDRQLENGLFFRTAFPKSFSACHTNLPNLSRIRHSSVFTSSTSPSSSVHACHNMLCCTSTNIAALTVRGFKPVYLIVCDNVSRPRVSRTDATA